MTHAHSHLDSCIAEVWDLLERIGHETTDSPGITRVAWSGNDERAADLMRTLARRRVPGCSTTSPRLGSMANITQV